MQGNMLSHRAAPGILQQQQRPYVSGRRLACAPVCAKKGKQANVKVNKRGKVTSRPGPGWQPPAEEMAAAEPAAQQQQEQQQERQPQQATPAAASSAQPAASPPQQQPQQQQQQQQQQPSAPQQSRGSQLITETPQVVVDRMFKRVITFAGLPVVTGMLLFPVFWYLRVVQKVEYPIWVVYVTQAMMFGGGLAGISYGILSTSWDPRREGSALGWTELQANLPILLNRNKDQQEK